MSRFVWGWFVRTLPINGVARSTRPFLEQLEARDLPSMFQPDFVLQPHGGSATPFGTPGPTGLTPAQVRHAYGFDQISFNNGTVVGDGSGTTIAIVDAYDDPNIASDLHQFDVQFGLPDPTFTKVNQNGGSSLPVANASWAQEISLDVEWAHAIAPKASILLVEASSASEANLFAAVRYAASAPGVVAVSMSWGGGEFSGESISDSTFQTPSGHPGVTFVASSGDSGAPPSYPATSPNVLSVGGTTLNVNSAGAILSESGWSGSGGGISADESQPGYQRGVVTQTTNSRANPDVAYDADPSTGFPVYITYGNSASTPWLQFGGTSDAAPQWAALIAIADQGRALAGLGSLDGATQTLPKLYALPSGDFHDITSGTSTGSPHFSAAAGYDLVTGLGSPVANRVVADLVGSTTVVSGATHFSITTPAASTAGSAFSVTVTALDSSGNKFGDYTGTVHFTSSDLAAVLPSDYTFTAADNGSHTFSVILKTASVQNVTATDTAKPTEAGSGSVTVSPAAASALAFGQQPSSATAGAVISPAVTVRVVDAYGNLVISDNTDQVTLSLASNAGGGALSGTTTATVSGGVATFANLSINNPGNGYTLRATSGSLTAATSAAFNIATKITNTGNVIEGFETSDSCHLTGFGNVYAYRATYAAHDGLYGLDMYNGNDWIYRNDAAAQVNAGDTLSVWLQFSGVANGRAYFGFGAGPGGTLSLVAAPNTGQLILQQNLGYGFTDLAAVGQTYQANHWYRLEVDWGASGTIVGKLFDSNGTTLLATVTATTTAIRSGGIAFRVTGNDKFFDTVTDTPGVNNFAVPVPVSALTGSGAPSGSTATPQATVSSPAPATSTTPVTAPSTPAAVAAWYARLLLGQKASAPSWSDALFQSF
jgi:hypothetical protein